MKIKDKLLRKRDSYSKNEFTYSYIKNLKEPSENIGNWGRCDLTIVAYGYSVGYKDLYEPFLQRIIEWLSKGIENNEKLGSIDFHQCNLTSGLAFATWIKTGKNDINLWKNTTRWHDELHSLEDYSQGKSRDTKEILALSILRYIQAQEYEKAIQLFQSIYGNKSFKLNSNMSGLRIAYAYCLHFYEGKFTVEQLEKAAKPFLEKHLVMLYTMGRSTEILYWLKTVCDAREKDYTPEEVIYTFYEYIPEEEKPDFVKELLGEKEPEKKSFFSSWFKW